MLRSKLLLGSLPFLLAMMFLVPTDAVAQQASSEISYEEAIIETIKWASGRNDPTWIGQTWKEIERAAYRYGIRPEFALAVISAEAKYGSGISWARYNVWHIYEEATGQKLTKYPSAFDDLDQAFSELRVLLSESGTTEEVFRQYWCGSDNSFNLDSYNDFSVAVSKLWNALRPYVEERMRGDASSKYDRIEQGSVSWGSLGLGEVSSYRTKLGPRPLTPEELRSFPGFEEDYANVINSINKNLSPAEALLIARAILTYCAKTEYLVDPRLVVALVKAESAFRPRAVSKVGALGLGQLMPATARSHGVTDPFDPVQNLYGCIRYIEREMVRWDSYTGEDKLDRVLASYNAGPGAVMKYNGVPPYRETQNFLIVVKRKYAELIRER